MAAPEEAPNTVEVQPEEHRQTTILLPDVQEGISHEHSQIAPATRKELEGKMTRLLLKIPKIQSAFEVLKETFIAFGVETANGAESPRMKVGYTVSKENLGELLGRLGISVTAEQVDHYFNEADFDENERISFREFLITVGLAVLSNEIEVSEEDSEQFTIVKNGYDVIKMMWEVILGDGGGDTISNEDLTVAFGLMGDEDTVQQRMAELDFDNNAEIEFPEFIFGIASWVGFEEEDF